MINPFSHRAMTNDLDRFTDAFASYRGPLPRAMYHDSHEYNSNWTPELLDAFAGFRGYRLEELKCLVDLLFVSGVNHVIYHGTCYSPAHAALPAGIDGTAPGPQRAGIEVTNLSANRLRDLDRRKIPWRVFHDINLVNTQCQPFDASDWPVMDSGLLGPVVVSQMVRIATPPK